MIMKKRTFTKEEKLKIIKEASELGINPSLENMVFIEHHIMIGKRS